MFDFHIHIARLPHPKLLTQLLLDRNFDFVAIACEPWEWREVAQLKKELSSGIKPVKVAYGIHPMIAMQASSEMLTKLRILIEEDKRAMVGETGIDKRYPGYEDGTQDRVFLEQAKLAVEFGRDLQIHCVGDYMRVLKLLDQAGFPQESIRPIFHRFGGDLNVVKKAIPYGALFSLHADSFRKKSTVAAIPHIPQERVFFETDADETFMRDSPNSECATRHSPKENPYINSKQYESSLWEDDYLGMTEPKGRGLKPHPVTATATTDPGTEAGMTRKNEAGMTNENATGMTCCTPEEILAELESRIESVRAAYAKCRE